MRARRPCIAVCALVAVIVAVVLVGILGGCGTAPVSTTLDTGAPSPATPATTGGTRQSSYKDIVYAVASLSEKLDLFLPSIGTGPFPVIVFVHGGAFFGGDKEDGQQTGAMKGLDRGYAVASIDYRLSGEAKFPAAVCDVKAAIRYLRANAGKYDLDPNKVIAWGDSAGGYLVSIVGTSGGVADLEGASLGNSDESSMVQAVVDWFGPIDFGSMDSQFTASRAGQANHGAPSSPESQFLGAAVTSVPDLVNKADPATYITADDPPFLIEHGTADSNVPVEQSKDFAAALTRVLGSDKVTLRLIEGAGHMDPRFYASNNVALVLDWLDARLVASKPLVVSSR